MSDLEALPSVSFDVQLRTDYESIDVNTQGIATYLRDRGMSDEAIGATSIFFSSAVEAKRFPQAEPTVIAGHYDTDNRSITCFLGSYREEIEKFLSEYDDEPMKRAFAGFMVRDKESEAISETLLHELEHRIDHEAGILGNHGKRESSLSDDVQEIHRKLKNGVLVPLAGLVGVVAEVGSGLLHSYPEIVIATGGIAVVASLRNFKTIERARALVGEASERYRHEWETNPAELRAMAALERLPEFVERFNGLPVGVVSKAA